MLQYCFCFTFRFFGHEACGILAAWPDIEPTPPTMEHEVLIARLPEKSLYKVLKFPQHLCFTSPRLNTITRDFL